MAKRRKGKKGTPNLPVPNAERSAPKIDLQGLTDQEIVVILRSYLSEGWFNRTSGPSPREVMWRDLVDLYWNRFDFSKKAEWQAKEVMPEVPMIVDRFAAAMREALTSTPNWIDVDVPNDNEEDIGKVIRKIMRVILDNCGRDPLGHTVPFEALFEEEMKLGALMMACAVVAWKGAGKRGYLGIDALDPRTVWLDTSGRNLFRIRRYEIDKTQLMELARMEDANGNSIYDLEQLQMLAISIGGNGTDASTGGTGGLLKMEWDQANLTGTGQFKQSTRQVITIDEFLCTIIAPDGRLVAENVLCVVAQEMFLIRGPEKNPFWHEHDWLVAKPLVTAPLSVYGKAYIENVATIARTFNELTNLILDGTFTTALKAFAMDANALEDPTQVDEGIWPNKIFKLADGMNAKEFFAQLDLGQLPGEAIQVWQALKSELQEAAAMNELSLGQFAPKGRTSAAEVMSVQNNSSTLMKSVAKNVENFLEILLNLAWKTWLQHMPKRDAEMEDVIGQQMYQTIYKIRKELAEKRITFKVRTISSLIEKTQKLQKFLNLLQVIAQNQQLVMALMQETTPQRLLEQLFLLFDLDLDDLKPTERDMLIQRITAMSQPQVPGAPPGAQPQLPTPNPAAAAAQATPVSNAAPAQ